MKLKSLLVAAMLFLPGAALAAPGVVTVSTGLRAGPGVGFPLVDRVPGGARVNIHGCLRGNAWCDISWRDDRGWVSSQYLEYLYRNHYVYLPDYVDEIDVPIVTFVLNDYWSSYYAGRPWYHRLGYWGSYWTSHQHLATRMTVDPRLARIGRSATREGAIATGRDTSATTRQQNVVATPAARQPQGHIARENVHAQQPMSAHAHMQPPMAHHEAPRYSNAHPPMAHVSQPQVARPSVNHGAPMSAHAQMPTPHAAAPAMPHGGGGAPHFNAAPAPHVGGPPAGGPPGRERH